jgi:SAM-dependent methyltransferase
MAMDSRPAEFHCGYAANEHEALAKGNSILEKFGKYLKEGPVVDLGCGEGALLLALKRAGRKQFFGVDSSEELLAIAHTFDVPLVESDIWEFLRKGPLEPAVYFYLDVMEHVPLECNLELLRSLPVGSRLIIQTPYTESILGHRFYLNVPSHVAPYHPWVIKKMLTRFGYRVVDEGSVDWNHPPNWKNKIRAFILFKIMGIDPDLILGGGNYFVVADRISVAGPLSAK